MKNRKQKIYIPILWLIVFLFYACSAPQVTTATVTSHTSTLNATQSAASEAAQRAMLYISTKKGIPVEYLEVYYDVTIQLEVTKRQYQVVTLIDRSLQGDVYKLTVDLETGQVYEDDSEIVAQEQEARYALYGNLHPDLYNKLQIATDEELIEVIIWLKAPAGYSIDQLEVSLFEELAQKYPEARQAMALGGKPFDVENKELARQIEQEYRLMFDARMVEWIQPLLDDFSDRGIEVTVFGSMPAFICTLTEQEILALSRREEIDQIYLHEDVMSVPE